MSKKATSTTNLSGILAVILVSSLVLVITGYLLITAIERPAQCTLDAKVCPDGSTVGRSGPKCEFLACPTANTVPQTSTISGKYVCIAPTITTQGEPVECAFGLETEEEKSYALDLALIAPEITQALFADQQLKVTGTLVPIEMISTDQWAKYGFDGILQATTIEVYE